MSAPDSAEKVVQDRECANETGRRAVDGGREILTGYQSSINKMNGPLRPTEGPDQLRLSSKRTS